MMKRNKEGWFQKSRYLFSLVSKKRIKKRKNFIRNKQKIAQCNIKVLYGNKDGDWCIWRIPWTERVSNGEVLKKMEGKKTSIYFSTSSLCAVLSLLPSTFPVSVKLRHLKIRPKDNVRGFVIQENKLKANPDF